MAAFRFRLENVLRHRKSLRDLAAKELTIAEINLQKHLGFIESLYGQVDQCRNEIAAEQSSNGMDVRKIGNLEDYILATKRKILEARNKSRELMAIVEQKRDLLALAAKEFKAIELLKEKQRDEHNRALKQKELKALDDINQMRFRKEKVS